MPSIRIDLSEEKLVKFESLCAKAGLSKKDVLNDALSLFSRFLEALDDGHSLPMINRLPEESGEGDWVEIRTPGLHAYAEKVRGK